MFGWFRRRREAARRKIFSYWDGVSQRYEDPMVIRRALLTDPEFSWETDPAILANEDELGRAALLRTLAAIDRAFGVKAYGNGAGLTEDERLQLYVSFVEWLQKKSEPPKTSPTSHPLSTSMPQDSPTTSGLDSSLIAIESPSVEPSTAG